MGWLRVALVGVSWGNQAPVWPNFTGYSAVSFEKSERNY